MAQRPVLRFAPSPNGLLHLGHAYSALVNFHLAKALGGVFLLRIEDIDVGRCRPEFITAIFEDLAWLGIVWPEPVLVQSDHFSDYKRAIHRLTTAGLTFRCYASRAELAMLTARNPDDRIDAGRTDAGRTGSAPPRDPDGTPLHPGPGLVLSEAEEARRERIGASYAIRLNIAKALKAIGPQPLRYDHLDADGCGEMRSARPEAWGNLVLARRDTPTSYHVSVVVDDARQRVSHVVRGRDLERATDVHRLLQALLGVATPSYFHHGLIVDEEGSKLAKSKGAPALRSLRNQGLSASDVRARLGLHPAGLANVMKIASRLLAKT